MVKELTESLEAMKSEIDHWKSLRDTAVRILGETAFENWKLKDENAKLHRMIQGFSKGGAA